MEKRQSRGFRFLLKLTSEFMPLLILGILVSCIASAFAQENPTKRDSTAQVQENATERKTTAAETENEDMAQLLPPLVKYRVDLGFNSLYFTTIPLAGAVLLVILALWLGKEDIKDKLLPFFGDGQFGQYIVVILVAGNVCTLAFAGILGRTEVSALYGGIIGYVLGKNTRK